MAIQATRSATTARSRRRVRRWPAGRRCRVGPGRRFPNWCPSPRVQDIDADPVLPALRRQRLGEPGQRELRRAVCRRIGPTASPDDGEMFTTRPPPRRRIDGIAAQAEAKGAVRFTATIRSQSSSAISSAEPGASVPAALINTDSSPVLEQPCLRDRRDRPLQPGPPGAGAPSRRRRSPGPRCPGGPAHCAPTAHSDRQRQRPRTPQPIRCLDHQGGTVTQRSLSQHQKKDRAGIYRPGHGSPAPVPEGLAHELKSRGQDLPVTLPVRGTDYAGSSDLSMGEGVAEGGVLVRG